MGVAESGFWIIRFIILIITSVVIIVLFSLFIINVQADEQRADVLAGRVMYGGGIWVEPGVINQTKFTDEVADEHFRYISDTIISSTVSLEVTDYNGDVILDKIIYNKPAHVKLNAFRNTRSVVVKTRVLPVVVHKEDNTRENALLVMEVLHEE